MKNNKEKRKIILEIIFSYITTIIFVPGMIYFMVIDKSNTHSLFDWIMFIISVRIYTKSYWKEFRIDDTGADIILEEFERRGVKTRIIDKR